MRKEHSAGIIVYRSQLIDQEPVRLYLLLLYPKGYWGLVKGHLEPDESTYDAAHRELKEETGLEATLDQGFEETLKYKFTDPQGTLIAKKVTYYVGKASSQEVTLSHEHHDYAWMPYHEAISRLTYKNAQQILASAEHFLNHKN